MEIVITTTIRFIKKVTKSNTGENNLIENNKNNNDINEEIEDKIDTLEKKFRNNNIARLNAKQCYANAGVMFFDLLSNLERIGDHANNISNIKEEYTHKIYI